MKRLIVAAMLIPSTSHAEEAKRVPNWVAIHKACPNWRAHCLARSPLRFKDSDPEMYWKFTKPAPKRP